MGIAIIAKDRDDEDSAIAMNVPVRRGLESLHLLDTSLAKMRKNYALGKPDAEIIGTPTLGLGGTVGQFKTNTNYIKTAWQEPFEMTCFIGCRSLDTFADFAHRPILFGTYASLPLLENTTTLIGGAGLRVAGVGTTVTWAASRASAASVATEDPGSVNATFSAGVFNLFVCLAIGTSGKNEVQNKTDSTTWIDDAADMPRFPSKEVMRIGSGGTTNSQFGTSEICFFQGHSVLLSQDEIDATVSWHRARQLRKFGRTL